jgi:hypothetical protein
MKIAGASFEVDYFECSFVSSCDPTHTVQVQLHRYQVEILLVDTDQDFMVDIMV